MRYCNKLMPIQRLKWCRLLLLAQCNLCASDEVGKKTVQTEEVKVENEHEDEDDEEDETSVDVYGARLSHSVSGLVVVGHSCAKKGKAVLMWLLHLAPWKLVHFQSELHWKNLPFSLYVYFWCLMMREAKCAVRRPHRHSRWVIVVPQTRLYYCYYAN